MSTRPAGSGVRSVLAARVWPSRWVLVAVAVAAVLGHLWFWYLPRVREASPRSGDVPAALFGDERFAVRVWIPYPHQTLGQLARGVGDAGAYVESLAHLAGSSAPWLPSFGPFPVPPARELTVARGADGGAVVAARMYPTMAVVGRLAGALAGNPWLAGGEVQAGGRTVRVGWRGTLWTLESSADALGDEDAGGLPGVTLPPVSVAVALAEAAPPLREGTYLVGPTPSGGVLCRRLGGGRAPAPTLATLVPAGVALVLVERDSMPAAATERPVRALLLSPPGGSEPGELPGAAAVARPGDRRFSMPGETLSSLLDLRLYERRIEGLDIVALDRSTLEAASRLAPALARDGPDVADLELWLEPALLAELAGRLGHLLGSVPVAGRQEIRFWRDVERALAPLGGYGSLVLVASGDVLETRLEPVARLTGPR